MGSEMCIRDRQRSVEMAAIIRSGCADLRDDLMEDAAYRYYFEKADALEE